MASKEILEQLELIKNEYKRIEVKPSYDIEQPEVIMLPMSDGVELYTVIQKPKSEGPFPTIVMRSCYPDQEDIYRLHAEEYCKRGFAFIYQFCRGLGGSQGEWVPQYYDRQDGKDTLDWINAQDWVESIGFFGCSYLAFTGWIIADILPEKVKTLYLTHYGTDRFESAYSHGLFRQDILTAWAMNNAGFTVTADYTQSVRYRPHINVDKVLWGKKLDWYRDWITNTNYDDPYWQTGLWKQLRDIPSKVKVPVYLGAGWYDHHLGSMFKTYENLSEQSKSHSVMRIGAWNHDFKPCVHSSSCENLENSDVITAFNWFDLILVRKQLPEGCVKTYQINGNKWQTHSCYPFEPDERLAYYLGGEKNSENSYTLGIQPDEITSTISFDYDPDNPVITHGAESSFHSKETIGSLLQPECGWRDDVVSFVSDPVEQPIHILGKVQVKLFVSSDAEDTSFTAKLMEVHPDGKAYNIRSGITTLAYRNSNTQRRMSYEPGSIVEVTIDFWDVSWLLRKGNSLRVDISSSDSPQYAVHTNYAGIWSLQEHAKIARQKIYTGKNYPSRIIIPKHKEL